MTRALAPMGRAPSMMMAAFVTAPPCSYVIGGVSLQPPTCVTRHIAGNLTCDIDSRCSLGDDPRTLGYNGAGGGLHVHKRTCCQYSLPDENLRRRFVVAGSSDLLLLHKQ
jgi:hypothetical protein